MWRIGSESGGQNVHTSIIRKKRWKFKQFDWQGESVYISDSNLAVTIEPEQNATGAEETVWQQA
jgi:hypothetical protein